MHKSGRRECARRAKYLCAAAQERLKVYLDVDQLEEVEQLNIERVEEALGRDIAQAAQCLWTGVHCHFFHNRSP